MLFLFQFARWEIVILLGGLAIVVALQLLNGKINTRYLLYGTITGRKKNDGRYFSPERVQLLAFTVGAALYYTAQVMGTASSGTFPAIPQGWLAVMGGSNAIYLGGKTYSRWFGSDPSQ
jgi:hypothetical protein